MTAQIFLNLILHSYIQFSDVNFLIFDECHHARLNHAMNQIMGLYKKFEGVKPHILGLTATLLNANCKANQIDEEIGELEKALCSKILMPSDEELVKKFSTNPNEVVIWYDVSPLPLQHSNTLSEFISHLNKIASVINIPERTSLPLELIENAKLINKKKSWERALGNMLKQVTDTANALGLFACSKSILALLVRLERMKLNAEEPVVFKLLSTFSTQLHYLRKVLESSMASEGDGDRPIVFSSSKMRHLFNILRNMKKTDSVLVFVELRFTAKVLFYVLQHLAAHNDKFSHILPDFIVGYNNNPLNDVKEMMFEKKLNSATLNRFNSKVTNVLIASDVLEEGTDIQHCNSVIKFDVIKTFRSYVQSKGRARHKDSSYYVFCEDQKTFGLYSGYQRMERKITDLLLQNMNSVNMTKYTSEEVEAFAPFGSEGPTVTIYSAISLMNRYTSLLPQDKYAKLTTFWWSRINEKGKTCAILQLPINSAIKEPIEGPYCNNEMDAKRVAALIACKKLYELGELDSKLLPRGNDCDVLYDDDLFKLWPTSKESGELKPGTAKRLRIYKKHCPPWITNCQPKTGVKLYVHAFVTKPTFPTDSSDRLLAFKNHLGSSSNFAMLSSKKLTKVCEFPLFMNVGEVMVSVKENCFTVTLTVEELRLLNDFHTMLFTEVLQVGKKFLVRDYEDSKNSYIIIPVLLGPQNTGEIDWDTVRTHKTIPKLHNISLKERGTLQIRGRDYENKVIVPWYRPRGVTRLTYIVTKVREDLSPSSPFPSDTYSTYSDYFEKRYDETVVNENQPLIEVRAISSKINCIKPRGPSASGVRKRKMDDDFEETLIPELCLLIEFPAAYMLKATLLPTLLHRLHHLLCAEELRQTIVKEAGLGKLVKGSWKKLTVDNTALQSEEEPTSQSTIGVSDLLNEKMEALQPSIYPWRPEDEPCDIERCGNTVDLLSIIHYNTFVLSKQKDSALFKEIYPTLTERSIDSCTLQNGQLRDHLENINLFKTCRLCKTSHVNGSQAEADEIRETNLKVLDTEWSKSAGPEMSDMLPVLTPMRANDIVNYERLETLGDSFLKFAVSLSLFVNFPDMDEGKLTQIKGKVVGNRNLFYVGSQVRLGEKMKANDFSPEEWVVPGFKVFEPLDRLITDYRISPTSLFNIDLNDKEIRSGLASIETLEKVSVLLDTLMSSDAASNSQPNSYGLHYVGLQSAGDKVVADSVEALIGVYLQTCGIRGAFKLCSYLKILPSKYSDLNVLLDEAPPSALMRPDLKFAHLIKANVIEETIGYKFKDQSFLLQAFTHSSTTHYATECYQRLEFLGDAILDFLITLCVYDECGQLTPGELTDLRSALVNNVTLSCLSVKYNFHKYLISRSYALTDVITTFATEQAKRGHVIGPEVLFLINEGEVQLGESMVVPKALGDVFESIIAAVYLDSGKCLKTTWKVIYRLMHNEIKVFSKNIPKNHIRLLYEKFPKPSPVFGKSRLEDGRVIIPVEVTYNVQSSPERRIFIGMGLTKSAAKFAAAKMALRYFHNK